MNCIAVCEIKTCVSRQLDLYVSSLAGDTELNIRGFFIGTIIV